MKCIILLSLVALCYSYPYGTGYGTGYGYGSGISTGQNIYTNPDGSVSLTTGNGRTITITRGVGQNDVVITTIPSGQVQPYGQYVSYQPTQVDALAQILNQYQGGLNQNVYQQLLQKVYSAVQSGQLSNPVYQALQNLYQGQTQRGYGNQVNYLSPFQQVQGQVDFPVYGIQSQDQYPYYLQNTKVQSRVYPFGVYEQRQVGYPGAVGVQGTNYGTGKNFWNTLISSVLYGNGQQYVPYGQYSQYSQYQQIEPITENVVGQLSQVVEVEKQILNLQDQINQQQIQQQQQQRQLLVQQWQQQQQQQQQQNEQQYVQQLQQQVQQEQVQVLEQQQQQQATVWRNILQRIIQQQLPSVYSQRGFYGVYGQNTQGNTVPLVV